MATDSSQQRLAEEPTRMERITSDPMVFAPKPAPSAEGSPDHGPGGASPLASTRVSDAPLPFEHPPAIANRIRAVVAEARRMNIDLPMPEEIKKFTGQSPADLPATPPGR